MAFLASWQIYIYHHNTISAPVLYLSYIQKKDWGIRQKFTQQGHWTRVFCARRRRAYLLHHRRQCFCETV